MAGEEPKYICYQIADLLKRAYYSTEVQVFYEGQTTTLPLVVVKGDGPTLLGRNWLSKIRLNWDKIHYMTSPGLHELLSKYDELFQERLGTFKIVRLRVRLTQVLHPVSAKPAWFHMQCERKLRRSWTD